MSSKTETPEEFAERIYGMIASSCECMASPKTGENAIQEVCALRRERDALREALKPFAHFAERFDDNPLSGLDDVIYAIHGGTDVGAEIRLSDLRSARAAINPEKTP